LQNDDHYMSLALKLAEKGRGATLPNPVVGAVCVKEGRILGSGYHRARGEKHAEIAAIEDAAARHSQEVLEGSTLYCTLEPCCFRSQAKRNPPCTEAILAAGIARVVAAAVDPNPAVSGRGIAVLRNHGITVDTGIRADQAVAANQEYFKFITTGIPYVSLKMAQSIDGRIAAASGDSRWITDENARSAVHAMRARSCALLVGAGTVKADDPALTLHGAGGRQPYRVILDPGLSASLSAGIFTDEHTEKTLVFTTERAAPAKAAALRERGVRVFPLPADQEGNCPLDLVLARLGEMAVASLLVEGGGAVFTSFIRRKLWDSIDVFIAPKIIGRGVSAVGALGTGSMAEAVILQDPCWRTIAEQCLFTGYREGRHVYGAC
jgi:diaminohydroxyphosphoribosylaminopyrimidine deaminase/5-amino-6-(5-phosphoribosylamino)uracil reductase